MYDADTAPLDVPGSEPDGAMAQRQLDRLEQLAEAGLQIALAIAGRVQAAAPAAPLAELTAAAQAYARVSRAVRLSILLQDELVKRRREQADAGRQDPVQRRKAHVDRALAVIKRVAQDHCRHKTYAVASIVKEAAERLDTDDIYGLVESRPVGELIALICRDLGMEPNWGALAQEVWAIEEAESGAGGSPFALRPASPPPALAASMREPVPKRKTAASG